MSSEFMGLESSKSLGKGTAYYGKINCVNNTNECGGSFYLSVSNVVGVAGFWVLEKPQLAILARIAKIHNLDVRINADIETFSGPWLKAKIVYDMAIEGDRGY